MGRVTRRGAVVVMALVAVLALAACGSGTSTKDKNAYAKKVNDAQQKFALTVSSADSGTSAGSSLRTQQRTLQRFEKAIDAVVKELRGIKAPSEVTKEHENLTSVMSGFGKAIGSANDAIRDPTPEGVDLAKRRLATATQSVNARVGAAIAAINLKLRGT